MSSVPVNGLVAFSENRVLGGKYYLQPTREQGPFNHTLCFSGPDALTPYTRFYVESSANHEGLVHIRSCYNNKYWVPTKINDSCYISVTAKEPLEDDGKDPCTLFEISRGYSEFCSIRACSSIVEQQQASSSVGETKGGFLNVYTNGGLNWTMDTDTRPLVQSMILIVDLKEEKLLPKYVRFKGDNGKYLGCVDGNVLKFECPDPCDPRVIQTIHHTHDGNHICIKSEKADKFWSSDQTSWIIAKASKDGDAAWYKWVTYGDKISLQNEFGKFLKRLPRDDHGDGLNGSANTVESSAMLQLEEAVLTRNIYNVQYHMDETRVYGKKQDLVMATAHSINYSSTETTTKLNLKYGLATTSSWSKSTTKSWGVSVSVEVGVPKLLELTGVDFSLDIGGHYDQAHTEEDGGSKVHSEEQSVDYEMKVPPRTKMTVQAIANKASYDIPYSYYQKDVLTNGVVVTKKSEDGLFRGSSGYEFTYKVTEKKLSDDDLTKEKTAAKSQKKRKL